MGEGDLKTTSPTWGCQSSETSSCAPPRPRSLLLSLHLKGKAGPVLKSLSLPSYGLDLWPNQDQLGKGWGWGAMAQHCQNRGQKARAEEDRWLMIQRPSSKMFTWSWGWACDQQRHQLARWDPHIF